MIGAQLKVLRRIKIVVLHFSIHQASKKLDIKLDILSREDATKAEKETAKAIQDFLMESLTYLLKKQGLKVTTKKIKKRAIEGR